MCTVTSCELQRGWFLEPYIKNHWLSAILLFHRKQSIQAQISIYQRVLGQVAGRRKGLWCALLVVNC